jgi:two-component system sensor histidine kinase TctE
MSKPQSLRAQLLRRLMLPLGFVVVLDAAVSYYIALHYTNLAYDRWLLDSARSLTQQVKAYKDKVTFELPPIAVEVFRWDDTDKTFFKVESKTAGFMAGDRDLPSPGMDALDRGQPLFSDSEFQGRKVRIISVLAEPTDKSAVSRPELPQAGPSPRAPGEVLVSVAETLQKRRAMMNEILLAVVLPQLLLVFITFLHLWTGINRGLRPLRDLAGIIAGRSARDLNPIPDSGVPLEVRSLTHTINALLQRLGSAMATQQRFIENAAHQLRTPLAGLRVQAERALRTKDVAAMQPALAHIKHSADRVSRLSTQLLVLARSESMLQGLREFSVVDLTSLIRDGCMDWVPKALERGMELGFEAPEAPLRLAGDETLLRELLNNLLDNAIRYGGPGGQINVRLEAASQPALIVEDDGPGIQPQETDKVFERFYRIPGSPGDGCGLGLAIVREIADLHSAQVRIGCGEAGRGTRVEVVFETGPAVPSSPLPLKGS